MDSISYFKVFHSVLSLLQPLALSKIFCISFTDLFTKSESATPSITALIRHSILRMMPPMIPILLSSQLLYTKSSDVDDGTVSSSNAPFLLPLAVVNIIYENPIVYYSFVTNLVVEDTYCCTNYCSKNQRKKFHFKFVCLNLIAK